MEKGGLSNVDILELAKYLKIPHFRGVFTRDALPNKPLENESGIVNLCTAEGPGTHWVAYFKNGKKRVYFDSFGQITPIEIQKYLKTPSEFKNNSMIIERNTDIVQKPNTNVCGHLCVYVVDSLSKGASFQTIINSL